MPTNSDSAAQGRRWWQFWRHSERIDLLTVNEREKQEAWMERGLRVFPYKIEPLVERPTGGGDIPPSEVDPRLRSEWMEW